MGTHNEDEMGIFGGLRRTQLGRGGEIKDMKEGESCIVLKIKKSIGGKGGKIRTGMPNQRRMIKREGEPGFFF